MATSSRLKILVLPIFLAETSSLFSANCDFNFQGQNTLSVAVQGLSAPVAERSSSSAMDPIDLLFSFYYGYS